jgi:hypothetical protein
MAGMGTIINAIIKKARSNTGPMSPTQFQALKNKHLKKGEKLPKNFMTIVREEAKKKNIEKPKVTIKKIPEGPRDASLSATFRVGGKGGTKSKSKKTYGKKAGGPVVKKFIGGVISKGVKEAAKKLKGNRKSATRLNEAGQRVRAAKENTGAAKQVGNKADRKVQGSSQAQKIRKREGQDVTNLSQPSGGSLGKTVDLADDGIPKYKVSANTANKFDKDTKKTKENIKEYQEKLTKLKSSLKAFGGKNPPLERRIESTQTLLTQAKQKLADKKSRGGPGGKSKLTTAQRKQIKKVGGKVIKKMGGGSLKDIPAGNKGLPNLPTATRNKMGYKKAGGMVKKMGGGKVYNYKRGTGSKTIKGRMSGNDVVAGCYD